MTVAIPSPRRLARIVGTVLVVAVVLAIGVRLGTWAVSPGPAAELARSHALQQIVTSGGTYLGHVVGDDGTYVRIARPAIVRPEQSTSNLVVQLLAVDPYDLNGDILMPRSSILLIGNVAAGSGLETAYRQATGELPQPTPAPSG